MMPRPMLAVIALSVALAGFALSCAAAAPAAAPVAAASAAPHAPDVIAIVVQDQAALRAAPRDSAQQQA